MVHPNKNPLKILEKEERGRIQGLPKFFGYPYYLRDGFSGHPYIGRISRSSLR